MALLSITSCRLLDEKLVSAFVCTFGLKEHQRTGGSAALLLLLICALVPLLSPPSSYKRVRGTIHGAPEVVGGGAEGAARLCLDADYCNFSPFFPLSVSQKSGQEEFCLSPECIEAGEEPPQAAPPGALLRSPGCVVVLSPSSRLHPQQNGSVR